jgi:hypothetical protein
MGVTIWLEIHDGRDRTGAGKLGEIDGADMPPVELAWFEASAGRQEYGSGVAMRYEPRR